MIRKMTNPSLLLPISVVRSRRCIAITRCQKMPMATLNANWFRPLQCRRVAERRLAMRAFQQLPAHATLPFSSFLLSSPTCTTLRNFASSSSSIETRKDALKSSDGVVGYPIDFDTASTIEGMCSFCFFLFMIVAKSPIEHACRNT